MNYWTQISVKLARQHDYLDQLYRVYPITPNLRRDINEVHWNDVKDNYSARDNINLVKSLLKLELFPVKDSYVAYFRKDPSAIERNPQTVNRIAGTIYEMSIDKIYEKCSEPKECNRQIGPMFKRWLSLGTIGCPVYDDEQQFLSSNDNAIYNSSDDAMKKFAARYLGYQRTDKGLDFIARFNQKYVIAEAKFLTDFGGHQDAQFEDAISTMKSKLVIPNLLNVEVIKIAILDGVLYIDGNNKMYKYLINNPNDTVISSLVLREYLYSV